MSIFDLSHIRDIDTRPYLLPGGGALDIEACPDCWERRAHIERYLWACRALRGVTVVDFGCGTGFGSRLLAAERNRVFGIDTDPQALEVARLRCTLPTVSFGRMEDFCAGMLLESPDVFATVAFEVIEHLEDPAFFLAGVKSRHLLASVPVIPTMHHNPFHRHDFTIESFRKLLERHFHIESWWIQVQPFHCEPSIAVFHGELK